MSYTLPTQTPFSYNVGICFHTNMCSWYTSPSVKYSRANQIAYSEARLKVITDSFKLIRVYGFRVAGFDSNSDLDPCTQALVNVMNADSDIEAVISLNPGMKTYLTVDSQITDYFTEYSTQFNDPGQVKAIMLGNEVNANGYTATDLTNMMTDIKANAEYKKLNIPLSVSFSELPTQSGDSSSDDMVKAIVDNWDDSWNGGYPFVFINPYPDASGIGNAAGVYTQQANVQAYYAAKYPKLQVFIGETGAEGATSDTDSEKVIISLLTTLQTQYTASSGSTVPTFLFEGVNESNKPGTPNQQFMGVYKDQTDGSKGADITLKDSISLPTWLGTKLS